MSSVCHSMEGHVARGDSVDILADIFLTIAGLFSFFPYAKALGNSEWLVLIASIGCIFLCALKDVKWFSIVTIPRMISYIIMVYLILMPYIMGNGVIGNRYSGVLLFFMGPVIFEYYVSHVRINAMKRIVFVWLVFTSMSIVSSTIALTLNPYLSRSIKSGDTSIQIYAQGVGGYELIYFCTLMAPCLLYGFFQKDHKKIRRIIYLILWSGCILITIMSNYTTAFLIAVISSVLVCLNVIRSKYVKFIVVFLSVFFLTFLDSIVYGVLLWFVDTFAGGGRLTIIFDEASGSVFDKVFAEFMADRWPTILSSIEAWLDNWAGGLITKQISYSGAYLQGLGQHSFVFDTLAFYGTIVGIFCVLCIYMPFFTKSKVSYMNLLQKSNLKAPFLVAMTGILVLNNATTSLAVVMAFIYPILAMNGGKT